MGVMAGSSMDGLDIVLVDLKKDYNWFFELVEGETIAYDPDVHNILKHASDKTEREQKQIDQYFGEWIAGTIKQFITNSPDFIALHGHTIIHEPHNGISWQLGSADVVARETGIKTIAEFRNLDISLGGQGAPLVSRGDFELFNTYDGCLNLGGIANVSVKAVGSAWDIGPCNQVLNFFAQKLGKEYDKDGLLAESGSIDEDWRTKIMRLDYFSYPPPKSLPNNAISSNLLNETSALSGLRTFTECIAEQTIIDIERISMQEMQILTTGGGALNSFLVKLLNKNSSNKLFIVPDEDLVMYKEAILFAFLGVLRLRNEVNVLRSVTGAEIDSVSGVIHHPE